MAPSWREWLSGARRVKLEPDELRRLDEWRATPRARPERNAAEQRWVVVDVESSGLDIRADRLIAIGAVAVRGNAVDLSDSFEVVLRQEDVSSSENILIHGIAAGEQRAGVAPRDGLLDFLSFIRGDPLIAYHSFFDEGMLKRAYQDLLGLDLRRDWLDLALLCPAVLPTGPRGPHQGKSLDDWLADFGICVSERHRAVADAVATAQLWLAVLPSLGAAGAHSCDAVRQLAKDYAWLRQNQPRS